MQQEWHDACALDLFSATDRQDRNALLLRHVLAGVSTGVERILRLNVHDGLGRFESGLCCSAFLHHLELDYILQTVSQSKSDPNAEKSFGSGEKREGRILSREHVERVDWISVDRGRLTFPGTSTAKR